MLPEISKIKGVHPGAILSREMKKRGLENRQFAISIGEFPQTISAISKGRRGINPHLSIKLGEQLGVNSEYFMLLQAYYEIEKEKLKLQKKQAKPDLKLFHKTLFWDTNISDIDWQGQRRAVIRRVFERGTAIEINEIISFYGMETTKEILLSFHQHYLPSLAENAKQYLSIKIDCNNG
jgi:plasmid maintenance system antidote protein VapI